MRLKYGKEKPLSQNVAWIAMGNKRGIASSLFLE
jgi:hypothetical protein